MSKSESSLACIVLAAGEGKRMKSSLPKVLHPILGKPMGHYAVSRALEVGCDPVVVVVGHGAAQVEESFKIRFGDQLRIALQSDQKGTGHAVQIALPALPSHIERILLVYGDTPLLQTQSLRDLCALVEDGKSPLALLTTVLDDPSGYGRIVRDDAGRLEKIVEHRDATSAEKDISEVNPGIYAATTDFLREALGHLTADNAQGEYYLTDIVKMATQKAAEESRLIPSILVDSQETLGVNDRDQLAMATTLLRQRCVQKHMEGGVSFEDPQCAYIDADIEIGSDTTVGPGVCLYGACTIGSGVTLHAGCVLRDCLVETGAEIFPYSVCDGASIGPRAKVGPFARLRPQTRLDESAKVGNFVEVKKSHLSRGAKASHLAYLGDAHLGERVNIGAGVITCNYDGHLKHPTYIEDDVFVGSNSTLVAPLTLGKGVYVAAGSTLTRNVKANALALGRARQDNKEGYASRFRKTKTKSD